MFVRRGFDLKPISILLSVFCIIIMLFGCHAPILVGQPEPDSQLSSSREPLPTLPNDTLYPFNSAYTWLSGGTILAVPDNGIIRYIDLNNQLVRTVTIPVDPLIGQYHYAITDDRIFVAGVYDDKASLGFLSACKTTDGDWVLANGAILDGSGKLVREFLRYTEIEDPNRIISRTLSDGRTVKGWEDTCLLDPVWINEDLVALNGRNRLFLYRVSTDKLTLVDDMSEWMQSYDKMQVYYGIQEVVPASGGCIYFACKNKEKSNTVRSAWFADETGYKALFDEQEFSAIYAENGVFAMLDWTSDPETGNTLSTHIWYATSEHFQLTDAGSFDGSVRFETIDDNRIVFSLESGEPHHYVMLDTKDTSITWLPSQIKHSSNRHTIRTRIVNGSLQYIYTALVDGVYRNCLYDTSTNISQTLSGSPFSSGEHVFNMQNTHYIEFVPDTWDANRLRIRPIQPASHNGVS